MGDGADRLAVIQDQPDGLGAELLIELPACRMKGSVSEPHRINVITPRERVSDDSVRGQAEFLHDCRSRGHA